MDKMEKVYTILYDFFQEPIEKIEIRTCTAGSISDSYLAACQGRKIFLKVQKEKVLPRFYAKQIEREVAGAICCKENGIPHPKILHYDLQKKYLVSEVESAILLRNVWGKMNSTKKQAIKCQIMRIIKKFHTVEYKKFGFLGLREENGQFETWTKCYEYLVDLAVKDSMDCHAISIGEADLIKETVQKNLSYLPQEKSYLQHMDLHGRNIFVKAVGHHYHITGIVDFGNSLLAPPYMDAFRINSGFLYGRERFPEAWKMVNRLSVHQRFSADLLNLLDYFVFLSFIGRQTCAVRKKILQISEEYRKRSF